MKKILDWLGGRTWTGVLLCLTLGTGAFIIRPDATQLGTFLTFLVAVCGVVAGRSVANDFKKTGENDAA